MPIREVLSRTYLATHESESAEKEIKQMEKDSINFADVKGAT